MLVKRGAGKSLAGRFRERSNNVSSIVKSQSRRSNLSIASQCREGAPRYRRGLTLEAAEDCDAADDGRHSGELGPCEPLAEEDDSGERGESGEL